MINEGTGYYRAELIDSDGDPVDAFGDDHPDGLPIGFHVIHIRAPEASILIDAGFDEPGSAWDQAFSRDWFVKRTPGLTAALATIGETQESITHVVITHSHFDHIAGLTVDREAGKQPRFRNAQVLIGRADYDRIGAGEAASPDITNRLDAIRDHGLLQPVDDGYDVVPGVTMIHTGGESPGHSIVKVASQESEFLAVGDLFHYPFEIEHSDWMPPWADRFPMLEARSRILEQAADSGATVIFSHHPFAPWGRIIRSLDRHTWQPA